VTVPRQADLAASSPDLAGVEVDLDGGQREAARRQTLRARRPAKRRTHPRHQLVHRERLDQVVVGPQLEGALGYLGVVDAGHQDDRRFRMGAGDLLDQLEPRLARQLDIAESKVEAGPGQLLACVRDACGELAAVALAERTVDHPQHLGAVVGGENPRPAVAGLPGLASRHRPSPRRLSGGRADRGSSLAAPAR